MLINKEHIVSLKKISDILDIKYSKIEKTVNSLIKSKKINNAKIDKAKGEIIFGKSIWYKQHVVCENCGAELVVDFGQTLICEYCSSALRVRRIDEKL